MKRLSILFFCLMLMGILFTERHLVLSLLPGGASRPYKDITDIKLRKSGDSAFQMLMALQENKPVINHSSTSVDESNRFFEWQAALKEQEFLLKAINEEQDFRNRIREGHRRAMLLLYIGVPVLLVLAFGVPAIKGAGRMIKDLFMVESPGKRPRSWRRPRVKKVEAPAPLLADLSKGNTTKQEVLDWFGFPSQKVMFTELEAWTYVFETRDQAKKDTAEFPGPGAYHSCIILFKGNLVYDYSIQVLFGPGPQGSGDE
jgi:hypothetical protein